LLAAALAPAGVLAQQPSEDRLRDVSSPGPAASPFACRRKNAADFVVDELNAGKGPRPTVRSASALEIEMVRDRRGRSATSVVTEYRNLVQRSNVDLDRYISSGNCLAIAPVPRSSRVTNFSPAAPPRIFETPTTSTCSAPRRRRPWTRWRRRST